MDVLVWGPRGEGVGDEIVMLDGLRRKTLAAVFLGDVS